MCRRERAAEKNLQRAGSSGSAASERSGAPPQPPRHGRTLSSGTAETAAAAALRLGGHPGPGEGQGYGVPGGGSGGGDGGESRSLPLSRVVSFEEQQRSMKEAREAAEAGAGLVKVRTAVFIFSFCQVMVCLEDSIILSVPETSGF